MNRVESDSIAAKLIQCGARCVPADQAAVIIVNTCTVTGEAEAKARKAVRRALKAARKPNVVVTGCAAAMDPEAYSALDTRVIVEPSKPAATDTAWRLLRSDAVETAITYPSSTEETRKRNEDELYDVISHKGTQPLHPRAGAGFRTRMGIKVQDGCDNACTFCVVHIARGRSISVPLEELVKEVRAAVCSGVSEVVLTGINLGQYRNEGRDLDDVLQTLLAQTAIERIRLSSIEPPDVTDALIAAIAQTEGRICAHLHLPLQSGCDTTLKQMGRLYDTSLFGETVAHLRDVLPQLALTTDVIAGFPGESDDDFEESLAFCERMGFAKMHVFRYSKRIGTPAAKRADQIAPPVIAHRARRLRDCADALREADAHRRIGTIERVLTERLGVGTSESYYDVALPEDLQVGSFVPIRFQDYRDGFLHGTRIC